VLSRETDFNLFLIATAIKKRHFNFFRIMSQTEHLSLYNKMYQLTKYLYERVNSFPRQYKYNLGQEIIDLSWRCLDLLVRANILPKKEKRNEILALSVAFDCLKTRLRMAQEIRILSARQYAHIQCVFVKEVGDMLGGWLKWTERNDLQF
jgi:hypothetical protein